MWTPKRVLMLVAGFALFFGAYQIYNYFLGGIDGLPPLPAGYARLASNDRSARDVVPRTTNDIKERLVLAFGADEEIANCPIKLDIRMRGLVLAAKEYKILTDGRLWLKYFNLAHFGKQQREGQFPEINTVRSREAYITFDKPVSNPAEMTNRKIQVAELVDDVQIVNNRGTQARDDDLIVFTRGHLWYEEKLNSIYTNAVVELTDTKSKPEPTTVKATGMDITLVNEAAPPVAGKLNAAKDKNERISGVERIKLRQDVEMNLWMDQDSGFLGGAKSTPSADTKVAAQAAPPRATAADAKNAAAGPETAQKVQVVIKTLGPFVYDMTQERAQFDILQRPNSYSPDRVRVHRINEPTKWDQLDCDRLVLQFRRKQDAKTTGPRTTDASPEVLEIETAVATADAQRRVEVASDKENLWAFGAELTYDARTKQTVLRGKADAPEVQAMKDGNDIFAHEIWLSDAGSKGVNAKAPQQAVAKGPGRVDMLDRATGKRNLKAYWKNELLFGKDGDRDLLTLTGDAIFEDTEHAQHLKADRLKVWLQPADAGSDGAQQKRLPKRIEAIGHVRTQSAEMMIHDTDSLDILFDDSAVAAGPVGNQPPRAPEPSVSAPPAVTLTTPTPGSAPTAEPPPGSEQGKPKKPIDLQARSVRVHVRRAAGRNDLDQVFCEGAVQVHQDPETPADKGVDIRGQTLNLRHLADGNILVVTGENDRLAFVQFDKLQIRGPIVHINQITNRAQVDGLGSLKMPSDKNLDGQQLTQPKDLTIHWNKHMFFNGQDAQFQGGVQADQDNVRMLCQELLVWLDRPVSLRGGQKSDTPARVDKLVCDQQVRVDDTTREGQRLIRYQRIESKELNMDNDTGKVVAPGPGVVTLLQLGAKDDFLPARPGDAKSAAPANPAITVRSAAKVDEQLKMTKVYYLSRMDADKKKGISTFYDEVVVVHVPSENPDLVVDLNKPLPPGGFTMRCDKLSVFSSKLNERKNQEMIATGRVTLESQEFRGRADEVKYNENSDLVILEGKNGNKAELYRVLKPGGDPDVMRADKIWYWRRTNDTRIENGTGFRTGK